MRNDDVLLLGASLPKMDTGAGYPRCAGQAHGLLLAYLTTQDLFEDGGVSFPYLFFIHELG